MVVRHQNYIDRVKTEVSLEELPTTSEQPS